MYLWIIFCSYFLSSLFTLGHGASTTVPPLPLLTVPTPTDKLEETVLTSMLKIVDEKFHSLSERLSQMERSISALQVFSIRKFRGLTNTVTSSAALSQAMHSKLETNDLETRTLKSTVNRISHDVVSLKKSNSKMFQKLDRSILYINRNIDDKIDILKSSVESLEMRREEAGLLAEMEAEEAAEEYTSRRETVLNCTVDLKALEEQIDMKFNFLRNQSHFQYEKLRNQSEVHFNKLKYQSLQEFERLGRETETYYKKQNHLSELQYSKLRNQSQDQYDSLKRQSLTQYTRLSNVSLPRTADRPSKSRSVDQEVFIDNEKLFLALTNMTSHVVEGISFIRHTESMLERIISNTDTLTYEQEQLRNEIVNAVTHPRGPGKVGEPQNNVITGTNIAQGQGQVSEGDAQTVGCTLPDNVLRDIATFSKNGSQLFEILTDLAQMSQVSLSSSIVELQDELLRMEETRVKQEAETKRLPTYASGDYKLALQKILNTSKNTLKMTEAMAPNTGWIPYIFHHVQYVEGQLNRSMAVTTRFLSEVRGLKGQLSRHDTNAQTQGGVSNVPSAGSDVERRNGSQVIKDDVLEFIYDTSVQLKRIMPALTRLIAEPEPLITLVEGRKSNEGRVEIYHKGQWGTICDSKLGHVEASAICRNLGYVGGVSAGNGQFGPGSGVTWAFNLTDNHPIVYEQGEGQDCSHRVDFGVMCDHMVRLVAVEGSNDVNTGHIEIYQNSKWRPVCAHGFGRNEAQVSCRQMGYNTGWMRNARGRSRDNPSVWMTNVQCRGSEIRLDACRHNIFGQRPCPGLAPATVTCE